MSTKQYWLTFGTDDPRTYTGLAPSFVLFFNHLGATLAPPGISEVFAGSGAYNFQYNASSSLSIFFLCDGITSSLGTSLRYIQGSLDPIQSVDVATRDVGTTMQAIGASNFALGTTAVAIGTTLLGYGSTQFAIGTTLVALGMTNVALGTTNVALGTTNVALGTTNVSLGTTSVALGITMVAIGTTLTGLGTTAVVIGTTALATSIAGALAFGSTNSSIGSTSVDPGDLFGYLKRLQELLEGNQTFNKTTGVLDIYSRGSSTLLREKTLVDTAAAVTKS